MPPISGTKTGEGVQAVVLALNLLEHIAQSRRALGVTELARHFDTTKSRVHRHLQTLVGAGYLIHEADTERYRASARLMSLGQTVSDGHELTVTARPAMQTLRDKLGYSVALSVPEPEGVRIVATLPGYSDIEMGVKPGSLLALHSSAQGKLSLAFGDPGLLRALMQAPLEALTPHTLTDPLDLAAALKTIRRQGWASAPNEALIGINALAAPIFDALGTFVGSVALVDSIQHIADPAPKAAIDAVRAAARSISADLGFRADAAPAPDARPARD